MLHRSLDVRLGVVSIVLGLVASACTATPEALPIASDPAALSYLAVVQATESDFLASFRSLSNAIDQSYSTRSVLVKATIDGDFVQAAEVALATATAAEPPASLAQDREAWVAYRETITRINEEHLTAALDTADLGALIAVLTKAEQAYGSLIMSTSREFCLAAAIDRDLCKAPDNLIGGTYGRLAHEAIRVYVLSMFGLLNFPDALTPSERSARLADNQPAIEAALKSPSPETCRCASSLSLLKTGPV